MNDSKCECLFCTNQKLIPCTTKYKIIKKIEKGRVNKCFHCVDVLGRNVFIKLNRCDSFLVETKNNNYLKSLGFNVPEIYATNKNELIMEYLDFIDPKDSSTSIEELGTELKKLHAFTADSCGMDHENYVGNDLMSNKWENKWSVFFSQQRWLPMINLLIQNNQELLTLWIIGMKVYDLMEQILKDVKPRLLHGDMNPDNWGKISNGEVYFFDTSCFYGDPLYDVVALTMWLKDADIEKFTSTYEIELDPNNFTIILYRCYIYLCCFRNRGNKNFKNKAIKGMKYLLLCFPKCYPSILNHPYQVIKDPILLVQGGSYNPIHKNHIRNLKISETYVRSNCKINPHQMLYLIMVPSTDNRIRNKCSNGFQLHHRHKMMQMVCPQNNIWIDLSQLFGSNLIENYTNIFGINTKIYIVCGTDTLKYNLENLPDNTTLIVIRRVGENVGENVKENEPIINDRCILLDNMEERQMSSTHVRSLSTHKQLIKYVEPDVANYLFEQQQIKQINKQINKHKNQMKNN